MRFILVLALLLPGPQGHTQEKEDVLILFVNEPVPVGAVKLGEKKVDEAYDCYTVFEENIAWRARKFKANVAKVDSYRLPSVWHPSHTGQVSFYSVSDIQTATQNIMARRDSLEHAHLMTLDNRSKVYFFRPASGIKTGYDLYLNGKETVPMKPETFYRYDPLDKNPVRISAQVYANNTEVELSVKEGKVYYVECRTLGAPPFAIFPRFCVISYAPGRFLYEELEKGAQSKSAR